jgi:hypothetical protein
MGAQRSEARALRVDQERHVIGDQARDAVRHQRRERDGAHQRVLNLETILAMMGRLIHQAPAFSATPSRFSTASGEA